MRVSYMESNHRRPWTQATRVYLGVQMRQPFEKVVPLRVCCPRKLVQYISREIPSCVFCNADNLAKAAGSREDICVLSASGTAAVINLDSGGEALPEACALAHVPYSPGAGPYRAELSVCSGCRRARVPAVVLATCALPAGLRAYRAAVPLTAVAARARRAPPQAEPGARDISDQLPFLEYELHKLLLAKLRMQGANALFSLQTQIAVGERCVMAIASGTAVRLCALPPPMPPRIKATENEKEALEIQKALWDAFTANKAANGYDVVLPELSTNGALAETEGERGDEAPALDLCADKDACVLELDEAEDVETARVLAARRPHMQVLTSASRAMPGEPPHAFAQVWRARLALTGVGGGASTAGERHVARALDGVAYKLRRLRPCALLAPRIQLELPTVGGTNRGGGGARPGAARRARLGRRRLQAAPLRPCALLAPRIQLELPEGGEHGRGAARRARLGRRRLQAAPAAALRAARAAHTAGAARWGGLTGGGGRARPGSGTSRAPWTASPTSCAGCGPARCSRRAYSWSCQRWGGTNRGGGASTAGERHVARALDGVAYKLRRLRPCALLAPRIQLELPGGGTNGGGASTAGERHVARALDGVAYKLRRLRPCALLAPRIQLELPGGGGLTGGGGASTAGTARRARLGRRRLQAAPAAALRAARAAHTAGAARGGGGTNRGGGASTAGERHVARALDGVAYKLRRLRPARCSRRAYSWSCQSCGGGLTGGGEHGRGAARRARLGRRRLQAAPAAALRAARAAHTAGAARVVGGTHGGGASTAGERHVARALDGVAYKLRRLRPCALLAPRIQLELPEVGGTNRGGGASTAGERHVARALDGVAYKLRRLRPCALLAPRIQLELPELRRLRPCALLAPRIQLELPRWGGTNRGGLTGGEHGRERHVARALDGVAYKLRRLRPCALLAPRIQLELPEGGGASTAGERHVARALDGVAYKLRRLRPCALLAPRIQLELPEGGGASTAGERHVARALDGVAYKLRRLRPCALLAPRIQLELPEVGGTNGGASTAGSGTSRAPWTASPTSCAGCGLRAARAAHTAGAARGGGTNRGGRARPGSGTSRAPWTASPTSCAGCGPARCSRRAYSWSCQRWGTNRGGGRARPGSGTSRAPWTASPTSCAGCGPARCSRRAYSWSCQRGGTNRGGGEHGRGAARRARLGRVAYKLRRLRPCALLAPRIQLELPEGGGASTAGERHVARALDGVAYKLRRLRPCALLAPRIQLELPEGGGRARRERHVAARLGRRRLQAAPAAALRAARAAHTAGAARVGGTNRGGGEHGRGAARRARLGRRRLQAAPAAALRAARAAHIQLELPEWGLTGGGGRARPGSGTSRAPWTASPTSCPAAALRAARAAHTAGAARVGGGLTGGGASTAGERHVAPPWTASPTSCAGLRPCAPLLAPRIQLELPEVGGTNRGGRATAGERHVARALDASPTSCAGCGPARCSRRAYRLSCRGWGGACYT
ncbi:hypothetical protein MSG28_012064 [Choristoneura fumiferana]|uniref:Uncharacterized protein n=1 Tax=Choristoneura fumiferana TaxID=7141 RepID=A0ACC0KMP1_CHOFU|nr:hypothetical protein MSG28_012064 [Choristoneura fumiferana]